MFGQNLVEKSDFGLETEFNQRFNIYSITSIGML